VKFLGDCSVSSPVWLPPDMNQTRTVPEPVLVDITPRGYFPAEMEVLFPFRNASMRVCTRYDCCVVSSNFRIWDFFIYRNSSVDRFSTINVTKFLVKDFT